MPKVSRNTASHSVQLEGLDVRLEHLEGGYSVCFERYAADADLGALFRGLPDDRCPLPRWGYVIKGKVVSSFPTARKRLRLLTPTTFHRVIYRCTTRGPRSWSSVRPTCWRRQ